MLHNGTITALAFTLVAGPGNRIGTDQFREERLLRRHGRQRGSRRRSAAGHRRVRLRPLYRMECSDRPTRPTSRTSPLRGARSWELRDQQVPQVLCAEPALAADGRHHHGRSQRFPAG